MAYSKSRVDKAGKLLASPRLSDALGTNDEAEYLSALSEAIEIVEWWRGEHRKPLSRVAANLHPYVTDLGEPIIAQRLKRVPTIAGKLLREPSMKLSRMEDVGGVRAVLPSQQDAYRVAKRLKKNWTITRFRDYVVAPKADGYRALHLTNRNRGRLIEVQLRTARQDEWANAVEGAARRFPGLKSGEGPPALHDLFEASAKLDAMLDGSLELDMSHITELETLIERADTFVKELIDES